MIPPNAVFYVEKFSVFFLAARFFGYLPKSRRPQKTISIWVFFFLGSFSGHPVYMPAPSQYTPSICFFLLRPTSEYLRLNLNKTAKKGLERTWKQMQSWISSWYAFRRQKNPETLAFFFVRNRLWVFFCALWRKCEFKLWPGTHFAANKRRKLGRFCFGETVFAFLFSAIWRKCRVPGRFVFSRRNHF